MKRRLEAQGAAFPARIYIDDGCDCCGVKDVFGVSWGFDRPVICFCCIVNAIKLGTDNL